MCVWIEQPWTAGVAGLEKQSVLLNEGQRKRSACTLCGVYAIRDTNAELEEEKEEGDKMDGGTQKRVRLNVRTSENKYRTSHIPAFYNMVVKLHCYYTVNK